MGIVFCTALAFSMALGAFALSPLPPDSYYYPIYDLGQRAVIFYENSKETLVLSTTFAGDADDFAWIIPTPARPEIDKVSGALFAELETKTSVAFKQRSDIYPVPLMFDAMRTESFSGPSVTVEETKEVGYYDATVVSANDSSEFIRWLSERGYSFPSTDSHLLNDYIRDRWHFTVVRIKPDYAGESVSASLRRGHSTPLKLTFDSNEIIYPIKLSQVKIKRTQEASSPTTSVLPPPPYRYDYNYRYQERFPVVIYTIANHRKQLSGFQTEYGGWMTKAEVEKLTDAASGGAWVKPASDDYFLTKLSSTIDRTAIDSDLRITDSPNNKTVNAPNPDAVYWFWVMILISVSITAGAVYLLIHVLRQPRSRA